MKIAMAWCLLACLGTAAPAPVQAAEAWLLRYRAIELRGESDPADSERLFDETADADPASDETPSSSAPQPEAEPSAGNTGGGTVQQRFVVQHSEPRELPFVKREEGELTIRFGDTRVAMIDDGEETVWDYDARRTFRINREAGTVREESLLALAGFAWIPEFDGIAGIDALIRVVLWSGALIETDPDAETDEAIEWIKRFLRPTVKREGDDWVLYLREVEHARATPSDHVIEPAHRDGLRRALSHASTSEIAVPLAELGVVPARLDYSSGEGGDWSRMRRLELLEARPLDRPIEVPDWGTGRDLRDWFERAVHAAREARPPTAPPPIDQALDRLARGQALEGLLELFDRVLTTGESPAIDSALIGAALADERFRSLVTAMRRDPEDGIAAVKSVRREDLRNGHVVDVLLADAYAARGDRETAVGLLLRALNENPRMAVVWLQLAAHYVHLERPVRSWTCLDMARRFVEPDSAIAERIDALERQVVELLPEYF